MSTFLITPFEVLFLLLGALKLSLLQDNFLIELLFNSLHNLIALTQYFLAPFIHFVLFKLLEHTHFNPCLVFVVIAKEYLVEHWLKICASLGQDHLILLSLLFVKLFPELVFNLLNLLPHSED